MPTLREAALADCAGVGVLAVGVVGAAAGTPGAGVSPSFDTPLSTRVTTAVVGGGEAVEGRLFFLVAGAASPTASLSTAAEKLTPQLLSTAADAVSTDVAVASAELRITPVVMQLFWLFSTFRGGRERACAPPLLPAPCAAACARARCWAVSSVQFPFFCSRCFCRATPLPSFVRQQ